MNTWQTALVDWRRRAVLPEAKAIASIAQCQQCHTTDVIKRFGDYDRLLYVECVVCLRIYIVEHGTNIVEEWRGVRYVRDANGVVINRDTAFS